MAFVYTCIFFYGMALGLLVFETNGKPITTPERTASGRTTFERCTVSPSGDELLRHLQEPRVRALLDTIAYAEGTLKPSGYRILFGGGVFGSFDAHPRKKSCLKRGDKVLCTTGAGRYQIQAPTWDHYIETKRINRKTGDISFSPLNQDRVAVQIMIDKGAMPFLYSEPIPFNDLFASLGKAWASMPGAPWKYTVYTVNQLQRVFKQRLTLYAADNNQGVKYV